MYTHIHIKIRILYILYIYALFYIYTFTRDTSKKMRLYVCMFYCPYQFYLRLFSISLCCCAFSLCFKSLFVCMREYVYTCDNANLFDNAWLKDACLNAESLLKIYIVTTFVLLYCISF